VRAVCTGPVVASTAARLGLEVVAELAAYSVDDVVRALERAVRARPRRSSAETDPGSV
jgi:hypothetical protein